MRLFLFYFKLKKSILFRFVLYDNTTDCPASNLYSNIKMPFSIFHCQRNEFNIHHMECAEFAKPNHVSLCSVSSQSAEREICNHFLILLLQKAEKKIYYLLLFCLPKTKMSVHTRVAQVYLLLLLLLPSCMCTFFLVSQTAY